MTPTERKEKDKEFATMSFKASIMAKDFKLAKKALDKGADINALVFDSRTALGYAIHVRGDVDMVDFLIKEGADIHVKRQGYTSVCQYVENLSSGAFKSRVIDIILSALPDVERDVKNLPAVFQKAAEKMETGTQKPLTVPKKAVFKTQNDKPANSKKGFQR